jgi:hypothetical protein
MLLSHIKDECGLKSAAEAEAVAALTLEVVGLRLAPLDARAAEALDDEARRPAGTPLSEGRPGSQKPLGEKGPRDEGDGEPP